VIRLHANRRARNNTVHEDVTCAGRVGLSSSSASVAIGQRPVVCEDRYRVLSINQGEFPGGSARSNWNEDSVTLIGHGDSCSLCRAGGCSCTRPAPLSSALILTEVA
jgi:hypothetical protein